jgi:hypothetical protein
MNMAVKISASFEDRTLLHHQDLSGFRTTTTGTELVSEASFDTWTASLGCTREDFVNSTGKVSESSVRTFIIIISIIIVIIKLPLFLSLLQNNFYMKRDV